MNARCCFPSSPSSRRSSSAACSCLPIGDNPIETYRLLIGSALWWPDGIGYTLFLATPLIFTGLAVSVAFRAGLLNIGAEGQLYVAAFATAWVGIVLGHAAGRACSCRCASPRRSPAGAIWGAIPGLLKARFGSHEVINTIMMNFIAVALVSYFTQYHYRIPGDPILQTRADLGQRAHPPRSVRSFPGLPERIPLNVAFLLALVACALVYVFLWRTKWGYELRATGSNPSAAEYGGISVRRQIVLAMAISGGLAGMVGINEVLGYRHRYYDGFSDNYGFTGIAVALLGRNHPVGVMFAALLFAVLTRGGIPVDAFTQHVTKDIVQILQATIILFVAAEALFREPFTRLRQRLRRGKRMADLFTISLIWSTIRLSTPLILAALGGLFSERSGVINIALEGMMLAGAFTAAAVTYATGSPWIGLAAAIARRRADRADPRRRLHPLSGRSGRRRDRHQHSDDRPAGISERRLLSVVRLDAADSDRAADSAGAHRDGVRARAAHLVRAVPHALRPAPARGRRESRGGRRRGHQRGDDPLQRRAVVGRARGDRRRVPVDRPVVALYAQHDVGARVHRAGGAHLRQMAARADACSRACSSGSPKPLPSRCRALLNCRPEKTFRCSSFRWCRTC